jgi:hypothetical protein
MRQEILEWLKASLPATRRQGWRAWREELRAGSKDAVPTAQELRYLGRLAGDELLEHYEEDVWRIAIPVYQEAMGLYLASTAVNGSSGTVHNAPKPADPIVPPCVFGWVFEPFHEMSVVFGASGIAQPRDATALIALARCLSEDGFPRTVIVHVPLGSSTWEKHVYKWGYQSVLFMGRLSLFGEGALSHWGYKQARFGFLRNDKPDHCDPPPFDPEYHCIYEELGDGKRAYYRTDQINGERIDYAVIQRYVVTHFNKRFVVVCCSGITSLGTFGAAQYLASRLKGAGHPGGKPIPLPPGIGPDSSLEALLEVRAEADNPLWDPSRVELCKLYVNRAAWSVSQETWESLLTITLVCENGDPRRVVTVKFDSKEEKMDRKGQAFKLLAAVCLQVLENSNGPIDLAKLAQDSQIWGGKTVKKAYVKRQLSWLKYHHLRSPALSIGKEVRLHAKVVIESVSPQPVAVGAVSIKRNRRREGGEGPSTQGRKPR